MPHRKPQEDEDDEVSPSESEQEKNDPDKEDGDDDEILVCIRAEPKKAAGNRASPRKRTAKKTKKVDEDGAVEELEKDLIKRVETAVLDCIIDCLEEKQRTDKGRYRGYSKKLVGVLAPRYPWLTNGMVTSHLTKRRRQKRKKDEEAEAEESPRPRKRGRSKKSEGGGKATEATPRKRVQSAKSDQSESSKKAAAKEVTHTDEEEEETTNAKDGAMGELKDPPREDEFGTKEKDGDDDAQEEDFTPKKRDPGGRARWRNPGGRPTGTKTRQRPRGSKIMTPEEKYDKDKYKQARDYAALEYHKIRHTTESKRLKKGVLDSIIADSKKRYGLPDDYKIAHSTILGRVKRGVLIATGTKSPMERVEEELVRLCNDRLKTMNRQLFAHEGTELANSLIKKYEMEGEIREWKLRHSYVATEADGKTPVVEKACYMGKAYWNQFLKRHGHRLEVRKVGRVGPQTPMVQVEDQLVEMVNALGRPVRPSEGVRLALSLVEGTPLETELRDFKVRTLKNKSAENKKGELLGPGYWRAFIRRNKQSLLYLDGKEESLVGVGVSTENLEASDMIHDSTAAMAEAHDSTAAVAEAHDSSAVAGEEAEPDDDIRVQTHRDVEEQGTDSYVAHTAPAPASAAVETYAPHISVTAASIGEDSTHYAQQHQWYNHIQRAHNMM